MKANTLPEPSLEAITHSQQLITYIKKLIDNNNGRLSFTDYMQACLYAPGLGYYTAGSHKFSHAGDFTTAPELSYLFGQCLAQQCQELFQQGLNSILEFGAGTGKLALDILNELNHRQALPENYFIIDISADLKQRQQQLLKTHLPHYYHKIVWLDALPKNFNGIVIANEVLDAMPIHRFLFENNTLNEYYVGFDGKRFHDIIDSASHELSQEECYLRHVLPENQTYHSEINLLAKPWLKSLYGAIDNAAVLLIDYGFNAKEYFHPQRSQGTLMCHYRHHAHSDPYTYPGLTDITSHVDFSYIAECANEAGFNIDGFIQQSVFLMNLSIFELAQNDDIKTQLKHNQALKLLTMPHEMGSLFKVLLITKNFDATLTGFSKFDELHKL